MIQLCACGRIASHVFGKLHQCCTCWVAAGNPPADWHPGCVDAVWDLTPPTLRVAVESAAAVYVAAQQMKERVAKLRTCADILRRETDPAKRAKAEEDFMGMRAKLHLLTDDLYIKASHLDVALNNLKPGR